MLIIYSNFINFGLVLISELFFLFHPPSIKLVWWFSFKKIFSVPQKGNIRAKDNLMILSLTLCFDYFHFNCFWEIMFFPPVCYANTGRRRKLVMVANHSCGKFKKHSWQLWTKHPIIHTNPSLRKAATVQKMTWTFTSRTLIVRNNSYQLITLINASIIQIALFSFMSSLCRQASWVLWVCISYLHTIAFKAHTGSGTCL